MDAKLKESGSVEVATLARCLHDTSSVDGPRIFATCQWDRLLLLAEEHGVRPWLCRALLQLDHQPRRAELQHLQRALAARTLWQVAELQRINSILTGVGVASLAYKGPTLAARAHGDVLLRECGDLDFFIPPKLMERAAQALHGAGYHVDLADGGSRHWRHYVAAIGQLPLRHEQTGLLVELHTHLLPPAFGFVLPFAQAWRRRQEVGLPGGAVPTLDHEDTVALLVAHGSKHVWACLGWIHDLARYVARHPRLDWDVVLKQSRHWQGERSVHLAWLLARDLLAFPPPLAAPADVRTQRLANWLRDRILSGTTMPPGGAASAWFQLQARDGWRTGLRWAWDLAFTPTPADWHDANSRAWSLHLRRSGRLLAKWLRG